MKKSKNKIAKRTKTKGVVVKHELTIKVRQEEQKSQSLVPLKESDLTPEQSGGKYMIPKTWISERQVMRLVQKTPQQFIMRRKGRGGMTFDYVPGAYFKKVLNFAFGWNWDFRIIKQEVFGLNESWGQVITAGELTVKDDNGHAIVKQDNGKADIKYLKETKKPMDLGNDFKASATDCLKRCAAQLGIASDVYGRGEVKEEVGHDVRQTVVQKPVENKDEPIFCAGANGKGCPEGNIVTETERNYSMKIFKKQLCRNCQNGGRK